MRGDGGLHCAELIANAKRATENNLIRPMLVVTGYAILAETRARDLRGSPFRVFSADTWVLPKTRLVGIPKHDWWVYQNDWWVVGIPETRLGGYETLTEKEPQGRIDSGMHHTIPAPQSRVVG